MSELGYKPVQDCKSRQRELQHRMHEIEQEGQKIMQQINGLLNAVSRLGYDLSILTYNSCCQDPGCPDCRDYPEKTQLLGRCNVLVDLRHDVPE